MSDDFHARLSMSRLPRILDCPGSVPLYEEYIAIRGPLEERSSIYADTGTFLHSIMEDHLLRDEYQVTITLDEDKKTNNEYKDACNTLLAWVLALKMQHPEHTMHIERRVSMKKYIPFADNNDLLEEVEGTCDLNLIAGRTLYAVDWKFGHTLVDPDSPQLLGYGAASLKDPEYARANFDKVVCVVGQPLSGDQPIKQQTFSVEEVLRWVKYELSPALLKTKANPFILNPTEKACQFCPVKFRCSARKAKAMATAQEVFKLHAELPNIVSHEEMSEVLQKSGLLTSYLSDLEKFAFNFITNGGHFPGYKVVRGRAIRAWKDEREAQRVLEQAGFELEDLSEVKFFSPAATEKAIGSKNAKQDWFQELITKPEGSLSLVPADHPKPAVQFRNASEVFADFVEDPNGP